MKWKNMMLTRDNMYVVAKFFFCRTNYYHATKLKAGKGKPALLRGLHALAEI